MSSPNLVYEIRLDFPLRPEPRYGWGRPPHPQISGILDRGRAGYQTWLERFLRYRPELTRIPKLPSLDRPEQPCWMNGSLPGLDLVTLYGFLAELDPARYFEIGVGSSTQVARRAIQDQGLRTRIVGIDAFPIPGIESVCDQLLPHPLEHLDLGLFDELESGDILFVDNSHRVFMNSDATVVFLDILPRLKPGVLVEFHDIALPLDYPPHWVDKFYSEQYMLAAYLLAEGSRLEILLPNAFITLDDQLSRILDPLWLDPRMNDGKRFDLHDRTPDGASKSQRMVDLIETLGSSFWIRIGEGATANPRSRWDSWRRAAAWFASRIHHAAGFPPARR